MAKPLISIIIPMYNASAYIEQCIGSIVSQESTFDDFELLVVNDGSSDNSLELVEGIGSEKVTVIDQPNRGVAIARNNGIEHAKGDYILFMDADDELRPNALKEIGEELRASNPDIIRFEYSAIDGEGKPLFSPKLRLRTNGKFRSVSKKQFFTKCINASYFIWLTCIRREIIVDNNLRFTPGMKYLEDAEFFYKLFPYLSRCRFSSKPYYLYRQHPGACTSSFTRKMMEDAVYLANELLKFYSEKEYAPIKKEILRFANSCVDSALFSPWVNKKIEYVRTAPTSGLRISGLVVGDILGIKRSKVKLIRHKLSFTDEASSGVSQNLLGCSYLIHRGRFHANRTFRLIVDLFEKMIEKTR